MGFLQRNGEMQVVKSNCQLSIVNCQRRSRSSREDCQSSMENESGQRFRPFTIDNSQLTIDNSQFSTSLDSSTAKRLRGTGIACCFKNVGFSLGFRDVCHATVELYGDGQIDRAVVRHAGAVNPFQRAQ
mgnify:CR=1 FL=1